MPTILLAIDAYTPIERLLPAALLLASGPRSALLGIFAQDSQLLQGASLPCTQEVGANTATCYPLTEQSIQKRVQRIADGMQQRLAEAAKRQHLPWEFQRCDGSISQIVSETQADVVLPGWSESSWIKARHVCMTPQRCSKKEVIAVVDDGSALLGCVIQAARDLSETAKPRQLVTLAMNSPKAERAKLSERIVEGEHCESILHVSSIAQLIYQCSVLRPAVVLIGQEQALAFDSQLRKGLAFIKVPLAIVRTNR